MESVVNRPPSLITNVTEPKLTPKKGSFTKHNARKIVSASPGHQSPAKAVKVEEEKARTFSGKASLEEIDKILENDAYALMGIKKDIEKTQREELQKIADSVTLMKKEYDLLHNLNDLKERELNNLLVKFKSLQGVDIATMSGTKSVKETAKIFKTEITEILDEVAAENRTIKMQQLMAKRLENEISSAKIESSKIVLSVEQKKHDLVISESNLQMIKQELMVEESQYDKLSSTIKSRKEQRESKITMLQSISLDGENSVTRLQSSLESKNRSQPSSGYRKRNRGLHSASGAPGSARPFVSDDIDEDEILATEGGSIAAPIDVVVRARRLDIGQVKLMVQRYITQSERIEKLQKLDLDLRNNLTFDQKRKKELSDTLSQTIFKIEQLASSRQIYQEVDMKDSALAAAGKECEDYKNKDFRLRLNIESLKQSIPRFLTKVTKVIHPKPTENQLNDAILKLEDELVKLIKVIGSALLKEATPDDLALMSQQSGSASASEANSEYARLQRLPGFSRLQRQLFFNLMTARPDTSENNIRITQNGVLKKPFSGQAAVMNGANVVISPRATIAKKAAIHHQHVSEDRDGSIQKDGTTITVEDENVELDRGTIKNISKLIFERDSPKKVDKQKVTSPVKH